MAICKFHSCTAGKRRGETLPARLRFIARRGVTLVELMIAMLILTIVCLSWLEIIGIQSARKEARRHEAVERLAGMMDAFMYEKKEDTSFQTDGYYYFDEKKLLEGEIEIKFKQGFADANPMFEGDESSIGYQLRVVSNANLSKILCGWSNNDASKWDGTKCRGWLVGMLYDHREPLIESDKPFFSLPVCLGVKE